MNKQLRIFWSSNSPWTYSGYGRQTFQTTPLIKKEGYEIALGNFFGLEGHPIPGVSLPGFENMVQYPKLGMPWGEDGCVMNAKDFGAHCCITLQDIWNMDMNTMNQVKNWIPIIPIDHDPPNPDTLERLKLAYRIVSITRHGENALREHGFSSTYIPHTVNTNLYQPLNQAECRKVINIPEDIYLVGLVGANKEVPPRKGFQEAVDAFVMFHEKHPKSALYLHVPLEWPGGFPLLQYCESKGLKDSLYYMNFYERQIKTEDKLLAMIYNAFDVLLEPSQSEGFGVPVIEAQSCGTPVIVNNFTSLPELVVPGKTGMVAKEYYRRWTNLRSYISHADTKDVYDHMETILRWDKEKTKKDCRQWIVDTYDTHTVFNKYWRPFLNKLENELVPDQVVTPLQV